MALTARYDPHVSRARAAARRRLASLDLVDMVTIAQRLHVARETPSEWRKRGLLPEEDLHRGDTPLWCWVSIDEWARRTGRHPELKATMRAVGA